MESIQWVEENENYKSYEKNGLQLNGMQEK